MKKEYFEQVCKSLEKRIAWCEKRLDPILSKDDLLNLPLKDYLSLVTESKTMMSDMDKIYSEWYHIIGMGNLSAVQQGKIFALIKKFGEYRTDIKCLALNNTPEKIPDIPAESTYKVKVLGNFTLTRKARGKVAELRDGANPDAAVTELATVDLVEEPITTEDVTPSHVESDLPYNIYYTDGTKKQIRVIYDPKNLDARNQIAQDFAVIERTLVSNRLRSKLTAAGKHHGLKFSTTGGTDLCVTFDSSQQPKYYNYYANLKK